MICRSNNRSAAVTTLQETCRRRLASAQAKREKHVSLLFLSSAINAVFLFRKSANDCTHLSDRFLLHEQHSTHRLLVINVASACVSKARQCLLYDGGSRTWPTVERICNLQCWGQRDSGFFQVKHMAPRDAVQHAKRQLDSGKNMTLKVIVCGVLRGANEF